MKKCDIVMKGGITSGIVYPGVVGKLAEKYDFQNVGGTSAGGIAAALTAAAELARRQGRNVFPESSESPGFPRRRCPQAGERFQPVQPLPATAGMKGLYPFRHRIFAEGIHSDCSCCASACCGWRSC